MSDSGYDAVLLMSFGGPEGPDQVMPFLRRVTRGASVPDERLRVVGEHYFARGGISPINQLCRDMIAALEAELAAAGIDLPVYWGNRNAAPFIDDAVAQMAADGVERTLAFVTSAYSSYSACRQYREDFEAARAKAGPAAPRIDKLRVYFNHPGFIDPLVDGLVAALSGGAGETHVFFSAHSIPTRLADTSFYVEQLNNACDLVRGRVGQRVGAMGASSLVWQSRSGPPQVPWLEPDIVDSIESLDESVDRVIVVPIGFVSDHMEVIQDLDTDAAAAAARRGIDFHRVATSGTDPRFIAMIVDLIRERTHGLPPAALGELGLVPDQCSPGCCPPPQESRQPS